MTTTALDPSSSPQIVAPAGPGRGVLLSLTATGAVLTALGVTLGPFMMFDARPYSELSGTATHLLHYAIWTGCLIALSQLFPRLAGLRVEGGRGISTVAATIAGVGAALDACARFCLAFVNPLLAEHAPALLDTPPDAVLLVPTIGAGVVAMVGVIWLGASGWRARVFPRPAVVLLIVGAVAIPVIGPLSNALVGAALVWIGLAASARR
jgi:hypothetical protein